MNIAEEIPDPTPWDTITVLKKDLQHPEDILQGWLLSEVELRASYPGTLERLMSWIYLAWDSGVQNQRTLVGLFSNALADKTLLAEEPALYSKFFRYRLEGLKASKNPLAELFFKASKSLMGGSYKIGGIAAEVREVVFERPLDPATRLRLLLDLLPKEMLSQPKEAPREFLVYGSISESTPSFAISSDEMEKLLRSLLSMGATPTKLRSFWEDVHLCLSSSLEFEEERKKFDDYIKSQIGYLRKSILQPSRMVLDTAELIERLVSEYIHELEKEGVKATVEDRIKYTRHFQEVLDSMKGRYIKLTGREKSHLLRMTTKLYLSNVFIEVAHELRGFRKHYTPPPMGAWRIGDHIKALSIPDTYRVYGMFIPGIFAMKRWEWWQRREFADICILMDVSGSTAIDNKIDSIREAVFCLVEACRFGSDSITFIPFSTGVNFDLVKMHSKDYDTIEDLVISLEPQGYTNITPALVTAIRSAEERGYQSTYIFTDGGVWDGETAQGLLEILARYGKIYLFLVGDKVEYLHESGRAIASFATVHEVSLGESLVEGALNEYFNK
ncbi:vWA domain-containing protein [Candidatus Hecatella orcuttiae]|uniref:vWA domain-containing protein n=1 Tax=Candidatus Hecatella orcuttiae TaxID=1935119 RepID=UPI002867B5A8|nr:vWA domain-containing protein [Candidatus Hecatella orcuttiae]